jgi:hypothetical protein
MAILSTREIYKLAGQFSYYLRMKVRFALILTLYNTA